MEHTDLEKQMMQKINKLYEAGRFWQCVSIIEFVFFTVSITIFVLIITLGAK